LAYFHYFKHTKIIIIKSRLAIKCLYLEKLKFLHEEMEIATGNAIYRARLKLTLNQHKRPL